METTVKEIHNSVDKAAEVLLMDQPYDSVKTYSRTSLGFTSEEMVADEEDHREQHDRAKYYQDKYPLYKFITEHQMRKIRVKYNLVKGNLADFKGAIPEKNINEMIKFSIDGEDIAKPNHREKLEDMLLDALRDAFPGSKAEMHKMSFGKIPTRETFYSMMDDNMGKDLFRGMRFKDINKMTPGAITITADKSLFKAAIPHICPIVTIGVKGGYLIISAWGDEASDPDIANQKMN
jgi:hypothetical protein